MIQQSDIFKFITDQFSSKLEKALAGTSGKKCAILTDFNSKSQKSQSSSEGVRLEFLCLEPIYINNTFERIQKKGLNSQGEEIEYNAEPASLFKCTYIVQPTLAGEMENLKALGLIISQLKNDNTLEVGEYDWVGNNGHPALVETKPNMDYSSQKRILNDLNMDSSPALFYEVVVGVDSDFMEEFTRVDERKFDMLKKED